jgi:hypothetical protein
MRSALLLPLFAARSDIKWIEIRARLDAEASKNRTGKKIWKI